MKTSSLLRSSLLIAGLLLCRMSAVHADTVYTYTVRDGDFHHPAQIYPACRHAPGWYAGHHHGRGYHYSHPGKHHRNHYKGHHGHGGRHGQGGHWLYGKQDDRHVGGRHG